MLTYRCRITEPHTTHIVPAVATMHASGATSQRANRPAEGDAFPLRSRDLGL